MSTPTSDKIKGRIKEAAGALTGDERLKREGRIDQATAEVKEGLEKIVDTAKDLIGGGREEREEKDDQ
ncbi:CsbD family protein [Myxococcota bacterium]|nr:CsbD family protein [Myxococcota bacterium]